MYFINKCVIQKTKKFLSKGSVKLLRVPTGLQKKISELTFLAPRGERGVVHRPLSRKKRKMFMENIIIKYK